jgi:DNA repair exonuclease SbcCD ATPase subunit
VLIEEKRKYISRDKNLAVKIKDHEQARSIIQKAAAITQNYLAKHLSGIVSKALASVFDDPYECNVSFVERRNSTECDIILMKDGFEYSPLGSCGYGVADVMSFTLRVAYLLLGSKRRTLGFDEPMRHLSEDRQPFAADLIQKLSKEFNIQMLIVTHEYELRQAASKIFTVRKINKIAQVKGELIKNIDK